MTANMPTMASAWARAFSPLPKALLASKGSAKARARARAWLSRGNSADTATAKAVGAEAWVSAGLRVAVMEITKNP